MFNCVQATDCYGNTPYSLAAARHQEAPLMLKVGAKMRPRAVAVAVRVARNEDAFYWPSLFHGHLHPLAKAV